jgi:hypothetical protein
MTTIGDLDGDGYREIAMGADYPEEDFRRHGRGIALILDGATLEVKHRWEGSIAGDFNSGFSGERLGWAFGSVGDVDLDGVEDFMIGNAPSQGTGRAYLRSGTSGSLLAVYDARNAFSDPFVMNIASAGDLDGDGRSEFIIASMAHPEGGPLDGAGQVRVLRHLPDEATFVRGDANGDGQVDMADAVAIIVTLLAEGPERDCWSALDVNSDAQILFADAVDILEYLFLGQYPPPAPFPECARHIRLDSLTLGCERSTCDG